MCSLRETAAFYKSEASRLSLPPNREYLSDQAKVSSIASGSFSSLENLPSSDVSGSITDKRKRKARDASRIQNGLQEMIESQTFAGFGEPVLRFAGSSSGSFSIKWQKVNTDSVREGLITRAPQSLRLHLIRSGITPYGVLVKKTARVAFPLILDLTRFVSRGVWEARSDNHHGLTNGMRFERSTIRILYRLESAILHYGYTHSSGHFVCIRRKPQRHGANVNYMPDYVRKSCPDDCTCQSCLYFGQVRGPDEPGKSWLHISDADVEEVGE